MKPVFFTDRDLGKKFPAILRDAGLDVERHADHFPQDCPDDVWVPEVGKRGWIAVTHDGRIRYKANELAAVMENRVALLVVIGHAPYPVLAQAFTVTIPRILQFVERHSPPYIAKVYRPSGSDVANSASMPGRVELWYPRGTGQPER